MAKQTYTKPFLRTNDLIALMESRGLEIDVPSEDAFSYLLTVNYYRFTGYAIPFLDDREHFKKNAKFSDIQQIYSFDRRLRELVFTATEAVELTFRATLAREFSKIYGPLGYLDPKNFPDKTTHEAAIKWMQKEFSRSDELCARHFRANYFAPPLWALVEVISFGSLVRLMKSMRKTDQNAISTAYGMRGDILASYLHHISVLRNMCAHHARLYDHQFSYAFRPLKEWKRLGIQDTRALFYQCALLFRLLAPTDKKSFDRDNWRSQICDYLKAIPVAKSHDPHARAAIPADPIQSPLWA